jgi:hypothetical protein
MNKQHFEAFLKLSPLATSNELLEGWKGKKPRSWLDAIGRQLSTIRELELDKSLVRTDIHRIVADSRVSPGDAAFAIMAWGGMTVRNAKRFLQAEQRWLPVVASLAEGKLDAFQAYDRFYNLSVREELPGCRPAYYTKLIFFLTRDRRRGERGFIMDQWLSRSICLIADEQFVRFDQPRRLRQQPNRYVSDQNAVEIYHRFCEHLSKLTDMSDETDPDPRIREENMEIRMFSEGRGKGAWRSYVVENDVLRDAFGH